MMRFLRAIVLAALFATPAYAQVPSYTTPYNTDLGAVVTLSAASTGVASTAMTNLIHTGVACLVHIAAISGTSPTLTVSLQYQDAASQVWTSLLTSAALTATGNTLLWVYPGSTAASNTDANLPMPRTWRVNTTIGGTTPSVTATVGCNYIN